MPKKAYQALIPFGLRTSVMAVAYCLALSGVPLAAHAAGLGKIVVFSALGQPLRAEIEVSATREELSDMKAQLASPDAFKQAGLDYATTLLGIRFSLDRRSGGQSVIKLISDKPINDPFVDLLLELNWPAGRLVREYTFLLDPPEVAAKGTTAPVALAAAKPAATTSRSSGVARSTAPIDEDVRSKAVAQVRTQESVQKSADRPANEQGVREVKQGDTLRKIASEAKPAGVSLEQMLVGLLNANQDAFDGGNMNRLKAGKILSVPDKTVVEAVSSADAKKIVLAQSSDWNAYRNKLAGVAAQTPAKQEAASQGVGGKITAKVEDKAEPAVEAKDQLKVSRTDTTSAKVGATGKRSEEDLIAKEKALKEANDRLFALEKSVAELQQLVELKNQNLAELQKQATAKVAPAEVKKPGNEVKQQEQPAAAVQAPTPVPPAMVVPAPKVDSVAAAPEKAIEKPAEPKAAEPAVKPEEVKPEIKSEAKPEIKPEPVPKPAEASKPKPVPVPPPPREEPGILQELVDNPLALAGGGGILALIAAYFIARRRRSAKGEAPLDLSSTLTPQSSLTGNSVFRSTGGQSVDTSHTPAQTDFSQAGPGSIDTDEVDPVAEADVYMAYGRDAQAEEILVEARQKDPKRYAIHLKLLEIYSNRKDIKQFETLATDLYGETGGAGADWEKAAVMGLRLDPGNPLFGASAPVIAPAFDADATVIVSSKSMKNTVTLPGELSQLAELASSAAPAAASDAPAIAELAGLDFDLGLGEEKPSAVPDSPKSELAETPLLPEPVAVDTGALDFDLAADDAVIPASSSSAADATVLGLDFSLPDVSPTVTTGEGDNREVADLDFDLGFETSQQSESVTTEVLSVPTGKSSEIPEVAFVDDEGVEFDVSLTESTFLGRSIPDPSNFDMSSIDLDLNEPELPMSVSEHTTDKAGSAADSDSFGMPFDNVQVATAVNPDFATEQAETIVAPQFDSVQVATAVNPDFATEQAETIVSPQFGIDQEPLAGKEFSAAQAETVVNPQFGDEQDLLPEFDISANEEVTTKLDLAKAYEEMGDFEGARELLQEVLKEGDAAQRENAQTILAKIGD